MVVCSPRPRNVSTVPASNNANSNDKNHGHAINVYGPVYGNVNQGDNQKNDGGRYNNNPDGYNAIEEATKKIFPGSDPNAPDAEAEEMGGLESLPAGTYEADMYARFMLNHGKGYPLYDPKSQSVNVGDVGYIDNKGAFNFLFNICPSQMNINPTNNPSSLPPEFTLKPSEEIRIKPDTEPKTHIFQQPLRRGKCLFLTRYKLLPRSPGSPEVWGPILELPEGATRYDVIQTETFRSRAARLGKQWYKYTIVKQRRDVANGSLYLVTSCTKCYHWGIALFGQSSTSADSLRFIHDKGIFRKSGPKYLWKGSSTITKKTSLPADSNSGSSQANEGSSENQCVFLSGYKIRLRKDIYDQIRNWESTPTEIPSPSPTAGGSLSPRQVLQPMRGGVGSDPSRNTPAGGTPRPAPGEVILDANLNRPPVHPSDLINDALLRQNATADIAITHDDVWCNLLKDLSDANLESVTQSYASTVDEHGCISLKRVSNPTKSLVIAIDVGTAFSRVSYALLQPRKEPVIAPVTFYPEKEADERSYVPSIVRYDEGGKFLDAGFEADPERNPTLSDHDGIRRGEWFKLRLLLPDFAPDLEKLWPPPEPAGVLDEVVSLRSAQDDIILDIKGASVEVEPVQVLADYLRYLFTSVKESIIQSEGKRDPTFSWNFIERNISFILIRPSGWEEKQLSQMREAAIAACLVNVSEATERITFMTVGEANLRNWTQGNPSLCPEGGGILIVDRGAGIIDLATYKRTGKGEFKGIGSPVCLPQGSVFVTARARDFFKERFKDSRFGSVEHLDAMAKAFDNEVKYMFCDPSTHYYVNFGSLGDNDPNFGISDGRFRVEGSQVAQFFELAVQEIIKAIKGQCDTAEGEGTPIKDILLVGGFEWPTQDRLKKDDYFKTRELHIASRPYQSKTTTDGAVSSYAMNGSAED